jgi:hypothetical protein
MATAIHLQRVKDTLANGISSLDDSQLMMLSDTNNELMYRETSAFYLCRPHAYTTDGVNFTYVDQDFKSVNVRGDTLAVAQDIQHYGDTDTYLRFETDKLTMVIGGVTFATLTEDTADTLSFFAGIAGTVGIGIATGLARCHIDSDTAFDTASTEADQDTLFLTNNKSGAGQWNVGPSIGFGAPGDDYRKAAIAAIQTGADADHLGLGFYTHSSGTTATAIELSMYLSHDGTLAQQASGSAIHKIITHSMTDSTRSFVALFKSALNTIGAFAATAENEYLGSISASGVKSDNSGFSDESVEIRFSQDAAAGATYNAGRIEFHLSTNAAPRTEKMRLTSAGYLGIGTTAPASITEIQDGLTTVGAVLTLSSKETSTVANDILGRINFRAALDGAGGDAILTGASIAAIAEDTFSASVNKTSIQFSTGASEAATEKMRLTSSGRIGIGTTAPVSVIDAVSANTPWVIVAANKTDNSAKDGAHAGISYDVDEEPYAMIYGICGATTNAVIIGGGTSNLNAATSVAIRTAAINTVAGTERFLVDSVGNVYIQTLDLAIMTAGKGIVVKDGSGHYWRWTPDSDGTVLAADLGTTFPVP